MTSSIYNLMMYLSYGEGLLPGQASCLRRGIKAVQAGERVYADRGWALAWNSEEVLATLVALTPSRNPIKPPGSCYFFALCAGCTPRTLANVWICNGEVDSMKGTFLHRQAELYLQAVSDWQIRRGRRYVPLRELMSDGELTSRARAT